MTHAGNEKKDASPTVPTGAMHLPVAYLDEWIAIVDKPAGLMTHDSKLAGNETEFATDRLRMQFGRPIHLIHRLDRATSGCLLLAFDRDAAAALGTMVMDRQLRKSYLAICRGWPEHDDFTIDHSLDGGPGKPMKKPATTHFQRLATGSLPIPSSGFPTSRYALLRCEPVTGRFRQIRRHLKHASHHLIGDTSHGDGRHNRHFRMHGIHRMLLHALTLEFVHPITGAPIHAIAPLDQDYQRALTLFNWPAYPLGSSQSPPAC
ncbi:MAG: pseudouridylate synthase [Xanthomonadaceae bacterium]|jgi:tRNA pseudouridine65 synthase|nr:pseudouridylate synthase [Xanthomonadaceae bacterium]